MRAEVEKEIKFKDGSSFPVGSDVLISINEHRPVAATIELINSGTQRIVRSANLQRYFPYHFPAFINADIEDAMADDVCVSLTGEIVEPDGWDSKGFPSILLAVGLM